MLGRGWRPARAAPVLSQTELDEGQGLNCGTWLSVFRSLQGTTAACQLYFYWWMRSLALWFGSSSPPVPKGVSAVSCSWAWLSIWSAFRLGVLAEATKVFHIL